ncbi:hypothetical protein AYI72_22355 [Shewanella algae]|nr:replication initiation protein [Corynebacterium casei]TVK90664.1 hypothetical protein AYI83_21550 [Shewanella algae]TVK91897.1 hypothetical protein AYI72_22355 [Shewanella algae]
MRPTTRPEGRFEQLWLPLWPLASDDLREGIYRTSRKNALDKRYVEANPDALSNLLVVDIDQEDALLRSLWDREDWRPNAVVENPLNGHAHAVWALAEPFTRTEYAKRKPLAYAAAVTEGLRRSVDGDSGYSGLITKNPEHTAWDSHWITDKLYTLDELRFWLEETGFMPPASWRKTRRFSPVGLGRNCALFESARTWAYREVRKHFGDADGLGRAIQTTAQALNQELFDEPLPVAEVDCIARSIHKWIITKSRMWTDGAAVYDATFTAMQSARGKKGWQRSAEVRREAGHTLWRNIG